MKPKTKTFMAMIDPGSCGSAVLCSVTKPKINKDTDDQWYIEGEATVNLTDCSRMISWDVGPPHFRINEGYRIDKLHKVIDTLTDMLQEMELAQEDYKALRREVEAHNKKHKKDEA